jgi:hypothetical protein
VTWKEKTIARILLLIARMLTDDADLTAELKALSNHIGVHGGET